MEHWPLKGLMSSGVEKSAYAVTLKEYPIPSAAVSTPGR
jgi:hypothetical protein